MQITESENETNTCTIAELAVLLSLVRLDSKPSDYLFVTDVNGEIILL